MPNPEFLQLLDGVMMLNAIDKLQQTERDKLECVLRGTHDLVPKTDLDGDKFQVCKRCKSKFGEFGHEILTNEEKLKLLRSIIPSD